MACEHQVDERQYRDTPQGALKLTVYYPQDGLNRENPTVVFFHGGGWWTGSAEQFSWQATQLTQRGFAAVLVEYRVHGHHGTGIAEAASDAEAALRYIQSKDSALHIDQNRIVLAGASAGGHLALSVLHKQPDAAAALWLLNPVMDVSSAAPEFGFSEGELQLIADLDPLDRESFDFSDMLGRSTVPWLIQFGDADPLWGLYQQQLQRLAEHEGSMRVDIYSDAGHGFFNSTPFREKTLDAFLDFWSATHPVE